MYLTTLMFDLEPLVLGDDLSFSTAMNHGTQGSVNRYGRQDCYNVTSKRYSISRELSRKGGNACQLTISIVKLQ